MEAFVGLSFKVLGIQIKFGERKIKNPYNNTVREKREGYFILC